MEKPEILAQLKDLETRVYELSIKLTDANPGLSYMLLGIAKRLLITWEMVENDFDMTSAMAGAMQIANEIFGIANDDDKKSN
jgi:hypothetical protein